eukprot:TRINITY_DN14887_c0_g1_i1.p1 TRINITY_DN14887_c0_g1~~TRINITY_DN14887_c0_g1_i1.p1  ORF type:complete len:231 (-),score=49.21 TRINITY_DN14887_c0_g1_i1:224-832(-)
MAVYGKAAGKGDVGASPYMKTCDNCGGRGHIAKDCPSPQVCNACGSPDHKKAECPNKEKRCDLCGKFGHLKIKCHSAGKGFAKGALTAAYTNKACDLCGQIGHLKATCPQSGGGAVFGKGKGKSKGADKTCDLCGQFGHIKANCPSDECWDFAKTGSCPRGDKCGFSHGGVPPSPAPMGAGKVCHRCGKPGHLMAACPLNRR